LCILAIFFTHSSLDEYLGWSYNLAIVNSAAINMGVPVFSMYADLFQLNNHEWGKLHYMVVLLLVFWENFILFSKVDVLIYIITNGA
jgi:hypothetical protein